MPARLTVELGAGPRPAARRREGGAMRILLLGDFSARPPGSRPELAARPTHRADVDTLDAVMARLAPALHLDEGKVDFMQLDDFHPDALYARLACFDALRSARQAPPTAGHDLLGQLLGGAAARTQGAPASVKSGSDPIDALMRRVVEPHVVPDTAAATRQHQAAVDAATSGPMRAVLHAPAFQALESAWRGAEWLISNLELGEDLELHLFDVTREEFLADIVGAQGRLAETGLHRALADRWRNIPGAAGWDLLVGLFTFGPGPADVGLLAALGLLAREAGGPLLAGGDPALALAEPERLADWNALRHSEAARWIGLAAPRLLLRRPYGRRSEPIVSFAFEEFDGVPEHEHLLWGSGALAPALIYGRSHLQHGWEGQGPSDLRLGDLPAVTFERDGEVVLQPCAETLLSERAGQALLASGLMPLMSHANANAVTVMRLQSVAEPAAALAGLPAS